MSQLDEMIDAKLEAMLVPPMPIEMLPKYKMTFKFLVDNWYIPQTHPVTMKSQFETYEFIYNLEQGKNCAKQFEFNRLDINNQLNRSNYEELKKLIKEKQIAIIYDKSQIILQENEEEWKEYLLQREKNNMLSDEEEIELLRIRQEERKKAKNLASFVSLINNKIAKGLPITDKEKEAMTEYMNNNVKISNDTFIVPAPQVVETETDNTPVVNPVTPPNTILKTKVEKVKSTENEHVPLGNIEGAESFKVKKKIYTLDDIAKGLTPNPDNAPYKSDNQEIITRYGDLGINLDIIERIARTCGYRVLFEDVRDPLSKEAIGLIYAWVYMAGSAESIFKDFTIDLKGVFFDNRIKFFPFIIKIPDSNGQCYENYGAYSFTRPKEEFTVEGRSFIKDFLMGGARALPEKGYYSIDEIRLHTVVDMRTLPNMDKDSRNDVKNRLISANDIANRNAAGFNVFEYALTLAPFSRFGFKSYDKETRNFELTNENISPRLFMAPRNDSIVSIKFTDDQVDVYKIK